MLLKLTHANYQIPVHVATAQIAAIYYSKAHECTHIISVGAIIPVSESVETILALMGKTSANDAGNERK